MDVADRARRGAPVPGRARPGAFLLDLALYLPLVFLIREVSFAPVGFVANGLFWSLTALAFASWRMRARGVRWADLGLRRPESFRTTLVASLFVLGLAIGSNVVFEIVKDRLPSGMRPDTSDVDAVRKFGELRDSWSSFLAILPWIWLESMLEEALDRGFLLTWIERALSGTGVATVAAVLLQAAVFGFRHSNDLSERSITVGLIGLAMGIGYVAFGRNLWPLMIAHVALNTVSMVDRVV